MLLASGVEVRLHGSKSDDLVKVWIKQDLEAQALIGLNVSEGIAIKIAHCTSAYSMLQKLEALYGRKSDFTVERLQRQFFGYKYDSSVCN